MNQYHYYDPEKYPDKEQFTMDINVKRTQKMIATTYFEVNIYKHLTGEKVAYQKSDEVDLITFYYLLSL